MRRKLIAHGNYKMKQSQMWKRTKELTTTDRKHTNVFVMESLLLRDVVERAGLDRNTARHILEHAKMLEFPEASGQGKHRRFSLIEALRLANCTRLVMSGMLRSSAEAAVVWLEETIPSPTHRSRNLPFSSPTGKPWHFEIHDHRYIQVRREWTPEEAIPRDSMVAFDVVEKKVIDLMELDDHHPVTYWNLTKLAKAMARA